MFKNSKSALWLIVLTIGFMAGAIAAVSCGKKDSSIAPTGFVILIPQGVAQ